MARHYERYIRQAKAFERCGQFKQSLLRVRTALLRTWNEAEQTMLKSWESKLLGLIKQRKGLNKDD